MRKNRALIFQILGFVIFITLAALFPMKKAIEHGTLLMTALFFLTFFCILHIHKKRKTYTDTRKYKNQEQGSSSFDDKTKERNESEAEIKGFYKDFIFESKSEAKKSYDEYRKQKTEGTLGEPQHSPQVISALSFLNITKPFASLTAEDIKKAYRKKAKEIHPDLNNNSEDSKIQMQRLNAHYELLLKLRILK